MPREYAFTSDNQCRRCRRGTGATDAPDAGMDAAKAMTHRLGMRRGVPVLKPHGARELAAAVAPVALCRHRLCGHPATTDEQEPPG
jgi:hypothetical protein